MSAQNELPNWPRLIHLAGADGSGKTTQARALLALLDREHRPARYVWLRFPHLISAPLLLYARWRGCSYSEVVEGYRHGYWDFRSSWLLSRVLPWTLLLDTLLATIARVYWPLIRGDTVVCDRFVVDILVDLMAGLHDRFFDTRRPGRWFLRLLPSNSRVAVVDLDSQLARQRCPELRADRSHEQRRAIYLELARRQRLPVVSNAGCVHATTVSLAEALGIGETAAQEDAAVASEDVVIDYDWSTEHATL